MQAVTETFQVPQAVQIVRNKLNSKIAEKVRDGGFDPAYRIWEERGLFWENLGPTFDIGSVRSVAVFPLSERIFLQFHPSPVQT